MPSALVQAARAAAQYGGVRGAGSLSGPARESTEGSLVGALLRPPLAALESIGDIVSRPQYALSEAFGELGEEDTGDPLEGLLRGFTEGYKGAHHPSFAERLIPEEEDEGTGTKIARFGAEVLTDPLTYFGPGLVKGALKGGLKGARAIAGTKTAQAVGESDIAQGMSRLLLGTDYNMRRYGGAAGQEAAERAARGQEFARQLSAMDQADVEGAVRRLGAKANDEQFWERVTDAMERGDYYGITAESQMARVFRGGYDQWANRLARFVDEAGDQFEVFDPRSGTSRRFAESIEPNYTPQFLKGELLDEAATRKGYAKKVAELSKRMRITTKEADDFLKFQTGNPRRVGNIEYARTREIPKEMLDRNALRNYLKYTDRVSRRYAMAQEFGVKNKTLDELMEGASMGGAGVHSKTLDAFRKGVQGRFEPTPLAGIAPTLLGLQVLNKLGPTSVIYQLGQHANIVVAQGIGAYVKGITRLGDKANWQQSAMAVNGALKSQMEQLIGRAGAAGRGGVVPTLASKYLGAIGFKFADALPRRISFAGGVATAERLAKQAGGKLTDDLRRMGVNAADLATFQQAGKFLPKAEAKIGLRASKVSQFEPDFLSLPPMWQSPEMRVAMQFRSFINEQTRFLHSEIMKPAIKYLDTNGKEGTIRPLVRALLAFPIAGQGVAAAREFTRQAAARVTGAKPKKRDQLDPEGDTMDVISQLVKDSLYVGAFGIAGDILEQAARGNLVEWAAGPTVGDITETFERGVRGAGSLLEGDLPSRQDIIGTTTRYLPGRRLLPIGPQELARGLERKYFR